MVMGRGWVGQRPLEPYRTLESNFFKSSKITWKPMFVIRSGVG